MMDKKMYYSLIIVMALVIMPMYGLVLQARSAQWSTIENIIAEPWVKVSDDPHVALEGLAFDRAGNLYVCNIRPGEIFKITPDKKVVSVFKDPRLPECASIDIHKDGRLFLCTLFDKRIVSIKPDGTGFTEIVTNLPHLEACMPDDGVFDSQGNFYFTNIVGNVVGPVGGIYRLSADLKSVRLVQGGLAALNGICLTTGYMGPEKRILATGYGSNRLLSIDLSADGVTPMMHALGLRVVGYLHGGGLDSATMDQDDNWYVCSYKGGRIFVIDASKEYFEPIAQILTPGRDKGVQRETASVVIKPGTNEGYMTACTHGEKGGAWIMKFKAFGKGVIPYSHQ